MPAAKKPAAKKPAAKKPSARKPAAKKPASRRRATARKRPAAKEPAAIRRLNKALDAAQDALASLRKEVGKEIGGVQKRLAPSSRTKASSRSGTRRRRRDAQPPSGRQDARPPSGPRPEPQRADAGRRPPSGPRGGPPREEPRAHAPGRRYRVPVGAAASANGLPSESRHTAQRSPGWITEPPSSPTRSSVASRSATVK